MKRIIEIEEKDLERIREIVERENKTALSVTTRGTAYITIADSKPYEERPEGDLISREALKATILEPLNVNDAGKNDWYEGYYTAKNEDVASIDNAPTVELSPVINMKPLTAEEKQGLIDAFKKSRLKIVKLDDEGIRGEWARHDEWVNGEYVGGFYHVNCPVIEEGYALYSRWETCFCPNCGAPMLKGGDET